MARAFFAPAAASGLSASPVRKSVRSAPLATISTWWPDESTTGPPFGPLATSWASAAIGSTTALVTAIQIGFMVQLHVGSKGFGRGKLPALGGSACHDPLQRLAAEGDEQDGCQERVEQRDADQPAE